MWDRQSVRASERPAVAKSGLLRNYYKLFYGIQHSTRGTGADDETLNACLCGQSTLCGSKVQDIDKRSRRPELREEGLGEQPSNLQPT